MVPEKIDGYEIEKRLGHPGMSDVYLAKEPGKLGRLVVIKVPLPNPIKDPEWKARFDQEAEVVALLDHSYVVPMIDYVDRGDRSFIVMRYMKGGSLADRLEKRRMTLNDAISLFERLATVFDEVHGKGIIHRDLKPGNILFDEQGNAFLSDFGIAKLPGSSIKTSGPPLGTPDYMSPEQARGEDATPKSDIYSLGVILCQMLTGSLPRIYEPIPHFPPERLTELGLPEKFNEILAHALAKNREERYATVRELAEDVKASLPVPPPPPPVVVPAEPVKREREGPPRPKEIESGPHSHLQAITPEPKKLPPPLIKLIRDIWGWIREQWTPIVVTIIGGVATTFILVYFFRGSGGPSTPTPSLTITPSGAGTPTTISTSVLATDLTLTPTVTSTHSPSPTPTITPTSTATFTATVTPTPVPTATATPTPTATRTRILRTRTSAPTPTLTNTPTPVPAGTLPPSTDIPPSPTNDERLPP